MKNRELKFRIWDGSKMHYVDLWWNFADYLNSDMPVMQFIGKQDIKGKDIYEGDYIQWDHYKTKKAGQVAWGAVGFWVIGQLDIFFFKKGIEIIGNIFENPGMIKTVNQ